MAFKKGTKVFFAISVLVGGTIALGFYTHAIVYTPPLIKGLGNETPRPGTGDPGNKRLNGMANDKIFSVLPPKASLVGKIEKKPATFRAPAFQSAGWDGPAVVMTFTSSETKTSVYEFYATQAKENGWTAGNTDRDGNVDTWTKSNTDGSDILLALFGPFDNTYRLSASAPAID